MKLLRILPLATLLLASCGGSNNWSVEGTVDGAKPNTKILLQGFNNRDWYTVDTLFVDESGRFAYSSPSATEYPEIFRLTLDGKSIYFPIDSIDNITINAQAESFDRGYTLSGSDNALAIMKIDHRIDSLVDRGGVSLALSDPQFKAWLNQIILDDTVGTVSYYAINKTVGGQPLYSAANKRDIGMLGAVAQKFVDRRPNDPRTPYIKKIAIERRKAVSPMGTEGIEVGQLGLFEISLPDVSGTMQSLGKLASQGKVTILSFTNYDMENSTAYNVLLNDALKSLGTDNVNIYQVGIANDEISWRRSAKNIPWTAVWSSPEQSAELMAKYNFASLPTTYIIDRHGDIAERVDDPAQISRLAAKHM